jgi:hypothetical protein
MRSLLILFLLPVSLAPQLLPAQSETPADRESATEPEIARVRQAVPEPGETATGVDDTEESSGEEQENNRQKRMLEIGLILTSGIVIVGVFLVVLTLLYGRRTKRQLAAGRGPSSPRDDLWYLKKSSEASSPNVSESEPEGGSE